MCLRGKIGMSFGVGSRQNIGILSGMMTWSFIDRIGDMIGEDLSLSLSLSLSEIIW